MRNSLFFGFCLLFANLYGQKLMILGTAQDAGKPQIACEKECCKTGSPEGKVVSLALLDPENMTWSLFEATPDISEQLRMIPPGYPALPQSVALSHAHIGHYTGLMYFGREACNSANIPVLCGPRMANFLRTNGPWSQLEKLKNVKLNSVNAANNKPFISNKGEVGVYVFTVPHRDEFSETLGFIIRGKNKSALFIPDIDKWEKWDYDLVEVLAQVDYAFIDGTFFDGTELPGRNMNEIPHPFIVESMDFLKAIAPAEKAKVHFIHFNHTNPIWDPDSEASHRVLGAGFNIAREGLIFDL